MNPALALALCLVFGIEAVATYRAARMVARERGPGDWFRRLRQWAADQAEADPRREWLEVGTQCVKCLSVWFGVAFGFALSPAYALLLAGPRPIALVWVTILPFAFASGLAASAVAWAIYQMEQPHE